MGISGPMLFPGGGGSGRGVGMSRGWVCLGVDMSRGWVVYGVGMSGKVGPQRGGYPPLRYGLQGDTVSKQAVCITLGMLSCFINSFKF